MKIKLKRTFFFPLIQHHRQYPLYLESDSETENEIEEVDIESEKQLPTRNDYQKQSMKTKDYVFPNESDFNDKG